MFYVRYLRSELTRRRARTILTAGGFAVGVGLVVAIAGVSRGLDDAQKTALDPLSSIGTDLTVTLAPQQQQSVGFGPATGPGGGGRELVQANQSVVTDLSKLGDPGDHFVHDFFLPGTQLTFPQSQVTRIASLPGVSAVTTGLVLSAVHQEGVVPKIVAKLKAGGQTLDIRRQITPPTQQEFMAMQQCLQKAGVGQQQPQGGGGFAGPGGGGGRGGLFDSAAARACLPKRLREFRARITTPEQTLRQVLDPPQTNITSTTYTIGGVDPSEREIGLVTPALVTTGRFLRASNEALVGTSYAKRQNLTIGSVIDLNGTDVRVVGLVKPPLGGQSADVYIARKQLQTLADQKGLANVVLVRADSSSDVASVQSEIEQALGEGAQVSSAKDVADSINGSLVDASDLAHNLGVLLAVLAAGAAFLLAALLTLSSIGKRVREIGTLKALGWSQGLVVRQVVGESVVIAALGGLLGVGLGVVAALAVDAFGPTLDASTTTGSGEGLFGLGQALTRTTTTAVSLDAPLTLPLLVLGFVLAVAGGLVAGTAGALRAARLRPADALRQVE